MQSVKSLIAILLAMSMTACVKSDYCHYVQVENESDFTGEWLEFSKYKVREIKKIEECKALDTQLDNGDGDKEGKVRWTHCYVAPDCNESGMF